MTEEEKQKLGKLNTLRKELISTYEKKLKGELSNKYRASYLGKDGAKQLVQLHFSLYHWILHPRDNEKFEQSQVVFKFQQSMELGMKMKPGDLKKNYFDQLAAFAKNIGNRKVPKSHATAMEDAHEYLMLAHLEYSELPDGYDKIRYSELLLPYPAWIDGEEAQRQWSKTKQYFNWEKLIAERKRGRH
jgi:hypothetical protein